MASSITRKAADLAHKSFVTGLFGLFGFGVYTVTNQVFEGRSSSSATSTMNTTNNNTSSSSLPSQEEEHPQAGFINMLRTKAQEEYSKYYDIGHREWYDKDDNSYLKQIPKPEEYTPKKR